MSRGLAAFLTFVSVIVLVMVVTALYLGGNVLRFVFHDERSEAPFVMVNLLDFEDAASAAQYVDGYGSETLKMIRALGGRQLWIGRTEELVVGNAADEWPLVALIEYPSRAAFIDMVTSSEYRARLEAREAALGRTLVFAGTPRLAFEPEKTRSYVVRLTQAGDDVDYDSFEENWGAQERELVERHGGALVWSADLNPLVADPGNSFDRITVLGFPDQVSALGWARDPERETLASLEGRVLARDIMLLARTTDRIGLEPLR